ncbi:hypothetical protein DM02DRAFT_614202 [Periconia macrospinosa]|uniref:Uncharacterized protein n=1 Tax=Periconia macrospinosa TaxID=97972 RepID=A0A2V1DR53_9PLEO|nr:hypothetical protein DM02DRAFT_614202 [Periconia macrospinosa]
MHLHSTLLALAATTSLTVAVLMPHIPDHFGVFISHNYNNGTKVIESLSDPGLVPIVTHDPTVHTRRAKFGRAAKSALHEKRRTDCWGHRLDSSGVDRSIKGLAEAVGSGKEIRTGPDTTVLMGIIVEAVITYYCISRPNSVGNLDSNDAWHAHNQMNSNCGQYMSGWFGWPGSVEIVGRAREGTEICNAGGPF